MRVIRSLAVIISIWVPCLACAEADPPAASSSVRDSAGVRIVESLWDARYSAPWSLGSSPSVSVGEVEGAPEYLLDRVVGAAELPDGTILVGNGGTNEVRFYGPDGRFLRAVGREGEGPGEFGYLRALGSCWAEGFVAFDLNWQMNAYRWSGAFVQRTTFRAPDGITPYRLSCDPHGHVLLLGWGARAAAASEIGFYATLDRLVLTNAEGELRSEFGERLVSERIGSPRGSRPHPAGRATVFAMHDDRIFVGSGERFEVEVLDLQNRLLALLRGPRIELEVTERIKAAVLESELTRIPAERRAESRRTMEEWGWPEAVPAYVDLRVDAGGTVWLRAFEATADASERWALMDANEGYLGDLELPRGHSLLDIGPDSLILLATDPLGVQRVVRLALDRQGPAAEEPRT